MAPRILLAGLFHETHTFVEGVTPLEAFECRRGEKLLSCRGDGSPLGAVVEVAQQRGWELIPTIDLRANPSATADDAVLETFWDTFRAAAEPQLRRGIDGIFLVLHGAMVCRSVPDVEGELLQRIARLPGAQQALVAGVLDLHANYTPEMARASHALVAYRENPHTDAAETSRRAAELLDHLLRHGQRPRTVYHQPPIVWPPTGVATADEPMRSLERMAREIEQRHPEIVAVNVLAGFAFADLPEAGPSFSAITLGDPLEAQRHLERLAEYAWEHRAEGNRLDPPLHEVLPRILAHDRGPVLIVEPADNIGGGAPGDCTGVLRALLEHDVPDAAVVINDPHAVAQLRDVPLGSTRRLEIGGRSGPLSGGPVVVDVELVSRSDGRFELEDPHSHLASMRGMHIDMGPCAVVRHRGIRVLLTSRKTPPFDLGQLRSQGIVPESLRIIGVKAAVAHRRAYDPIAAASYTVDTPGPCSSDLRRFPYRRLRRPIYPLDA
jgi:microcystin degradation protein MlrC